MSEPTRVGAVLTGAEAAGWPRLVIAPGVTVPAGRRAWMMFATRATDARLAAAMAALRPPARRR
jgi:hypothetical protein